MNNVDRIRPWMEKIKNLLLNRWFRLAVQISILVLCAIYLINNLQSIKSAHVDFHVNIYLLIISCGITICTVLLGAFGFYLTLKAMSIPINWSEAINIHLQSNLAKYIPGYAWQLIGKAYLTKRTGVSVGLVGMTMTIELIQLLLAGMCVAFLSLTADISVRWGIGNLIGSYLPVIRFFSIVIFLLFPIGVSWILKKTKINNQTVSANPMVLLGASLSMFASWILFGYSFWLIGKTFFPVSISQLLVFVFTMAASVIIGLAIVIVPGSIGVRESIMVWLLGPIIGGPQAVIIAAISRVNITISELVSAFAFKAVTRHRNNPKVLEYKDVSGKED
jgi:uncharacterized membrane protein YbhN (UPF0104 family)